MRTIRDIQEKTIGYFASKGVPNPKLDTDLLIAHILGIRRLDLYLDLDRPLTDAQLDQLRPLVKRRAAREPLQYLLGTVEFFGLALKVDARALIPRPETEELVEHIRARLTEPPARILDLGTGSGAIAIALAIIYPNATVVATDQSADALALARENADPVVSNNRIQFLEGSWFEPLSEGSTFDLIVSNPPYLTEAEMQTAEPEVVQHEPVSALVSGADGLKDLRQIIVAAARHLHPGGLLALETGIAQHPDLDTLCAAEGMQGEGVNDLSGRPRFYLARRRQQRAVSPDKAAEDAPPAPILPQSGPSPDATSGDSLRENRLLRKGRLSLPNARYFITCCTENRQPGLEQAPVATALLQAVQELHAETSIDLLTATVMPDHVHLLFQLGRRLKLAQVVSKFKSMTRNTLMEYQLTWQADDYEHRLRVDDAAESFSRYIFLNPYCARMIPADEVWPWWVLNQNYQPEFLTRLENQTLPPREWIETSTPLKDLIAKD